MIKAAIFDMDGTLANTLLSIAYFANNALKKFGIEPIETEKYKILVGNGAKNLIKSMLLEQNCYSDELYEKVFNYYDETYHKDCLYKTEPYDGIIQMLNDLKKQNIKIGILSNKPHKTTLNVAKGLFDDGLIDACYGQRDGFEKKPNPSVLISMIKDFGVQKDEVVYLGDTSVDMKTGKNADVLTVGVSWGFRSKDELKNNGADYIINHPSELLDIIKKCQSL